MLILNTETLL